MAKILFGAGVGDARGSVGGNTFSKGRFGAILRTKVSPVQPRSATQQTVRGLFSALSKAWGGILDDTQRAAWNALANVTTFTNAFGNTYHPTGLQLYQLCNRNLDVIGEAHIDDAPADLTAEGLLTVAGTAAAGTPAFSVAFTATPAGADSHVVVAASGPFPAGRTVIGATTVQMAAGAAATTSPVNILTAYTARFGTLRAGTKIKVEAWVINEVNGAATVPISDIVTVAA